MAEVTVRVNNRHTLTINFTHGGEPTVVDRHLDLSQNNLFRHPFDTKQQSSHFQAPTALQKFATEAFRALDLNFSADSNVLVKALDRYRHERLPKVIEQLMQPLTYDEIALRDRLSELGTNKKSALKVLSSIVTQIDHTHAAFFDTEKMLGTFGWLSSPRWSEFPISFVTEQESAQRPRFCFVTPKADQCLFDIEGQKAFVPRGAIPDPLTIIECLCRSGSTGAGVRYINRAAAMQDMTHRIANDIHHASEFVRDCKEQQRDIPSIVSTTIGRVLVSSSVMLAGLWAIDAAVTTTYAMHQSIFGIFTMVTGVVGAAFLLAGRMRASLSASNTSASFVPEVSRFLRDGWTERQSILSNVLLHFLDRRGSTWQQPLFDTGPVARWDAAFGGIPFHDPRVRPSGARTSQVERRSVEGDGINSEDPQPDISIDGSLDGEPLSDWVRAKILGGLAEELVSLDHIEIADRHWNLLAALEVVQSFARWAGLSQPVDRSLIRRLLFDAQTLTCSESGYFGPMKEAFEWMQRLYQLSNEDWAFCAQPLYVFDLLERTLAQREAQRIALDILLGDAARSQHV